MFGAILARDWPATRRLPRKNDDAASEFAVLNWDRVVAGLGVAAGDVAGGGNSSAPRDSAGVSVAGGVGG
ncbi:MAG: hypothetical protein B7Z55_03330 [Planctomycetales bacterium 12-60-4]|nr:MAG: hypothetical protein B7Z55_03330 [Planctomycetales bacterium 12-60-4]